MRINGVEEAYITGDKKDWEKFKAWAATVPYTLRNPLYHWTHLELARYFGINILLNQDSAERIWKEANEKLAQPELTMHGILKKFQVRTLCTTDDPVDDLKHHVALARSNLTTRVLPAFRPDKALQVQQPENFNGWVDRLAKAANVDINNYSSFIHALRRRH